MLHLDTGTIVAYFRGDEGVTRILPIHIDELAMSSVVLAELNYGARASARPDVNLGHVSALRSLVPVSPFDEAAAEAYGVLRASLRSRGPQTGDADALIAAVALAHGAKLITHNKKHFENIEGLAVEARV